MKSTQSVPSPLASRISVPSKLGSLEPTYRPTIFIRRKVVQPQWTPQPTSDTRYQVAAVTVAQFSQNFRMVAMGTNAYGITGPVSITTRRTLHSQQPVQM